MRPNTVGASRRGWTRGVLVGCLLFAPACSKRGDPSGTSEVQGDSKAMPAPSEGTGGSSLDSPDPEDPTKPIRTGTSEGPGDIGVDSEQDAPEGTGMGARPPTPDAGR